MSVSLFYILSWFSTSWSFKFMTGYIVLCIMYYRQEFIEVIFGLRWCFLSHEFHLLPLYAQEPMWPLPVGDSSVCHLLYYKCWTTFNTHLVSGYGVQISFPKLLNFSLGLTSLQNSCAHEFVLSSKVSKPLLLEWSEMLRQSTVSSCHILTWTHPKCLIHPTCHELQSNI